MLMQRLAILIVAAACAAALVTASAGAAVFLRVDPSGSVLPANSFVQTSDMQHITEFWDTGIHCVTSSAFTLTVGASGGASVTGTVKTWTLNNCSSFILGGVDVTSCAQTPSVTTRVTFTLTEVLFDQLAFRCSADPSGSCYYTAPTATGTYSGGLNVYIPSFGPGGTIGSTLTHVPPPGMSDDLGAACGTGTRLSTALTRLVGGSPTTRLTVTAS
jgi:hypothetical protein